MVAQIKAIRVGVGVERTEIKANKYKTINLIKNYDKKRLTFYTFLLHEKNILRGQCRVEGASNQAVKEIDLLKLVGQLEGDVDGDGEPAQDVGVTRLRPGANTNKTFFAAISS